MIDSPAATPSATRRSQVFLVDDHPLVREGLAKVIEREPDLAICDYADSPALAYERIVRSRPDAVVVDLSLGGQSGLDLIKQLQLLPRPPPVLVLSMHDEIDYAERAIRAGALGYVMKRETATKIIDGIRRVVQGRTFFSENVAFHLAENFTRGRGAQAASSIGRLSDRELEIFRLIGQGLENRRIAGDLHLSLKTVQTHCAHIKEKLGLAGASELMREAVRWVERENAGAGPADTR